MNGLRALTWIGGAITLLGLVVGAVGLCLFGSAFMTPSSTFFADPHATMDTVARNGFLGVVLFGLSGVLVPGGGVLLTAGLVLRAVLKPQTMPAR